MEPLNLARTDVRTSTWHQSILFTQVQGTGAITIPLLLPRSRPGGGRGLPLARLSCSYFPPTMLDVHQCHNARITIRFHQFCSGTVFSHQPEDEPGALPSWGQLGWCSDTYCHMVSRDDSLPKVCYYPGHTLSICLPHFIITCTKSSPNLFCGCIPPLKRG